MKEIINEINNNDNIVVLVHKNPDGDAIGSGLSLYLLLRKLNKNVDIIISDAPNKFSYLDGFSDIKITSDKKYDLGIILDTATRDRINASESLLNNIKRIVNIDHHISNELYGDVNYVDGNSASCSMIVYAIANQFNVIDKSIGEAIFNGLLTDTGGFRNNNTDTLTYKVAYELSKIIDTTYVFKKSLGTVSKSEFNLRKIAIERLEYFCENKIAYSYVKQLDIDNNNATVYDCSGLINIAREIEGVEVSIFSRILNDVYRVSLRSLHIDVNVIASKFGGGGHKYASGINLDRNVNYEEFLHNLIKEVELALNEWNNNCK